MLTHDEAIQLQSDQLASLYSQLGEEEADKVICKALEDIANQLSLIERCYYTDEREALSKAAQGLVGVIDSMGMPIMADVAQSVAHLANQKDDPALTAVLARLVRLGDRSLTAIWEVQDLNGAI